MTPTDILILAQTAGLTLMPAPGGNLRAGPPDALTPELRIALREHKAGLLALLCCSVFGCYQPGNVVELGGGFMARLCSAHRRELYRRARETERSDGSPWLDPHCCPECEMFIPAGSDCPRCSASPLVQYSLRLGARPLLENGERA